MTIPDLDLLVARYGENARVIDVILAERALRQAWKEKEEKTKCPKS